MDSKGLTWAGNIYQKFEAMCLEVEEVIYEDTVKYVENQVQKVGVSVKKFYSEVMQDLLLPPSCVDPLKADGDLSLNSFDPTNVNKKTKLSKSESQKEIKKNKTEGEMISDITVGKVFVETTHSELWSAKSKKVGIQRRAIGIKRISHNIHPAKVSFPISGELAASDDMSSLDSVLRHDPAISVNDHNNNNIVVSNTQPEFPTTDKILSVELLRRNNSECTLPECENKISADSVKRNIDNSEGNLHAFDKIVSTEFARQREDDSECTSTSRVLPSQFVSTNDISVSGSPSHIRSNDFEVESNEDNFDMEVVDSDEVTDPSLRIFELVEKSKLDDSCVFVEGDEHFVQGRIQKQKSYKKKLCEAISSKLRSGRKQDQFVSQFKDESHEKSPALKMGSCESEWELL